MAIYRSGDLEQYAAEQVTRGTTLKKLHRPDGLGCCQACGRLEPCDTAREGERLVAHYRPYVSASRMVRPYVHVDQAETG